MGQVAIIASKNEVALFTWRFPAVIKDKLKIQLLVFWLSDRKFGVRLRNVLRVVRAVDATPLPQAPEPVSGVISVQGTLVPVLNMRSRLGFSCREIGLQDQFIIAETSKRVVALLVDHTVEVIECSQQEIIATKAIAEPSGQIEGVIQLKDDLLLIHDLERFLYPDEEVALDGALIGQADHGN
jgi:purine-binding chemotaxis protein CheW